MSKARKILNILADNKWDYAKIAQITAVLGGAKQATLKFASISALAGIVIWEALKLSFRTFEGKLKKQSKKGRDEINSRTEIYLSERKKLVEADENTDLLDKEYNEYMETALGSLSETEKDDTDSSKIE